MSKQKMSKSAKVTYDLGEENLNFNNNYMGIVNLDTKYMINPVILLLSSLLR
jgi:hypothetical protein